MKVLSILAFDPNGPNPQDDPDCPARMHELVTEMRAKGVLLDTGGRGGEMFEMKIARKNGSLDVTDGPFTESKEVVGGYALLNVKDRDDAIVWTDRFLGILGAGTCYVREVISGPE